MEEFLQNMKTLRSQMNDVEDQAAKISVEEQMLVTTIETLQKDLESAKSEAKQLKVDTDLMVKEKGEICSQILFKQRKLDDMELVSCTLSKTLALIQQENVNSSAKLVEKSTYYTKVEEDFNTKLQEQQDWMSAHKHSSKDDTERRLIGDLDAAKAKFDSLTQMKCMLISESSKVNQSIEMVKSRIKYCKPELNKMDKKSLEEEIAALLSDKAGETEYLQHQIGVLKGISHMVRCGCGLEYKVELDCAQ